MASSLFLEDVWIPAFAGMTCFGYCDFFQLTVGCSKLKIRTSSIEGNMETDKDRFMEPNVYFSERFDAGAIAALFASALKDGVRIEKDSRVAVKVHFGEKGNTGFVSPERLRPIIASLQKINRRYFLTDANTLYRGMRLNAADHLRIAKEHGFGALATEIVIADGEQGADDAEVEIGKKIFSSVKIARGIAEADAVIAVSHFKGHILFGFGGAIKNIGMGCGSRAGKLEMHSKIKPSVSAACIECGACIESCPAGAISDEDGKTRIDHEKCIGCAGCIAVCGSEAIEIPWHGATSRECMERCAEYAFGALKGKQCLFLTFINRITSDCDCMPDSRVIGEDVGVAASVDPVACDRAAYDLVLKKHGGRDIFKEATGVDGRHILDYAEQIGLGAKGYRLVRIPA